MNNNNDRRMLLVFILAFAFMIGAWYLTPKNTAPVVPAGTNAAVVTITNYTTTETLSLLSKDIQMKTNGVLTNVTINYGNELYLDLESTGARVHELRIDGKWNRMKQPVSMIQEKSAIKLGDLAFGMLDNQKTYSERPVYQLKETQSNKVVFITQVQFKKAPVEITKTYIAQKNYQFNQEITLRNLSKTPVSLDMDGHSLSIGMNYCFFKKEEANSGNILVADYYDGKKIHQKLNAGFFKGREKSALVSNLTWLSLHDNYFMTIARPSFSNYKGKFLLMEEEKAFVNIAFGVEIDPLTLGPGESKTFSVQYYAGPKSESILTSIDKIYSKYFEWFVMFNWLMKPIEWALVQIMNLLAMFIGNWGLIIIVLALIIKLVLSPLSIKAAVSIKRSNLLQPKLKNIQAKYKDDQKTLNEKIAELYKKEGVNPLGGCLPLILQIPVFFALYKVLSSSVDLKGASFLWIKDLTQPDMLFAMAIPLLPAHFNLLPVIMTIVQLIQMRLQSLKNAANPQQNAMNTYLLPVIFLFLFWGMPSGLVLYWTVQNLYAILEQELINFDKHVNLK